MLDTCLCVSVCVCVCVNVYLCVCVCIMCVCICVSALESAPPKFFSLLIAISPSGLASAPPKIFFHTLSGTVGSPCLQALSNPILEAGGGLGGGCRESGHRASGRVTQRPQLCRLLELQPVVLGGRGPGCLRDSTTQVNAPGGNATRAPMAGGAYLLGAAPRARRLVRSGTDEVLDASATPQAK